MIRLQDKHRGKRRTIFRVQICAPEDMSSGFPADAHASVSGQENPLAGERFRQGGQKYSMHVQRACFKSWGRAPVSGENCGAFIALRLLA